MYMRIVFDPGHGLPDPGACGNNLREMDLTLKIAKKTAVLLDGRCEIKFTRESDQAINADKNTDLAARCQMANDWEADYYISFHINAFNGSATGFESYIYPGSGNQTQAYRNVIHRKIAAVFAKYGLVDRGQQQNELYVLHHTSMPAALYEYGFIDNVKDAGLLKDDSFLDELAKATADGLAEALGLPQPLPQNDYTGHWAEKSIEEVISKGWMSGYQDGTFKPDQPVTRAEMAAILTRISQS